VKKAIGFILFLVSVLPIAAQDSEAYGAAARAMGGGGLTLSDTWSGLNNPATLAQFSGFRAGISYRNRFLLKEMADKSASVCFNLGDNHFAVGVTSFGYSLFSRSRVGLSYARKLGDGFFGGVRVNYHRVRLGENYGSTQILTAELGAIYKVSEKVSLGAQVFNPTNARLNDYADERLESTVSLGIRFDFSKKVFATAQVTKPRTQGILAMGGMAYMPHERLTLRIGANNRSFSFGMGTRFGGFLFDLSASFHPILGFTPETALIFHAPE